MASDLARFVYRPYPELVERELAPEPYEIRDSHREALPARGMVDLRRRVMWVPLDPSGRPVTRHELGHVRWSPANPVRPKFDRRLLMCVEDARINLGLARCGVPVVLDAEGHAHVAMLLAQDAKRRDAFAVFVRAIASLGTSVERAIEEQLLALPGPLGPLVLESMLHVASGLEAARAARGGAVAPYETAVTLARELAQRLRALGLLDARLESRSSAPMGCCVAHRSDGDGLPDALLEAACEPDARAVVAPGRMAERSAPLTVPLRPGRGSRAWRAAREGSVVRYLSRWPIDGAVFRRRARAAGGTLLVDTSGSMSLEVADLDRLLLGTPHGMRVAIYSGSGDAGELRIVADGGRRAAPEHLERYGTGNVVDLPALQWLASQRTPRLWISDGGVTGVGDRGSARLKAECESLCRRARIRRVSKLEEAARLLHRA